MNNREYWKAKLPYIQAFTEGKIIEERVFEPHNKTNWAATEYPSWDLPKCEHRIAPEPREWWEIRCRENGSILFSFSTRDRAEREMPCESPHGPTLEIVHVREVLEEGQA